MVELRSAMDGHPKKCPHQGNPLLGSFKMKHGQTVKEGILTMVNKKIKHRGLARERGREGRAR